MKRKFRAVPGKGIVASTGIAASRRNVRRYVSGSTTEPDWSAIQEQLSADYEDYNDPFYEMTRATDYIVGLCEDVDSDMNLFIEPSVQGGSGGVWIMKEDTYDGLVSNYDYATFNDEIGDIVFEVSSAEEFKRRYREYLERLIAQHGEQESEV